MIYSEKYLELVERYNVDETCEVIKNESFDQLVYQIYDNENNEIWFDFSLVENVVYITAIADGDIVLSLKEEY